SGLGHGRAPGRRKSQIHIDTSWSSASDSRPWLVCIAGRRRLRTCSDEEDEGRQARAVVVHGDTQILNPVIDPAELDSTKLRHLPHLPLHHLAQRILGPVHVAFRDVSAEIVVSEAVGDPRGDRLAFASTLLCEDTVGDRAHRAGLKGWREGGGPNRRIISRYYYLSGRRTGRGQRA